VVGLDLPPPAEHELTGRPSRAAAEPHRHGPELVVGLVEGPVEGVVGANEVRDDVSSRQACSGLDLRRPLGRATGVLLDLLTRLG
jgi:hypothetical protein